MQPLFHIRLQSAAGRIMDVALRARSERVATTAALREAETRSPGSGWLCIFVLGAAS